MTLWSFRRASFGSNYDPIVSKRQINSRKQHLYDDVVQTYKSSAREIGFDRDISR